SHSPGTLPLLPFVGVGCPSPDYRHPTNRRREAIRFPPRWLRISGCRVARLLRVPALLKTYPKTLASFDFKGAHLGFGIGFKARAFDLEDPRSSWAAGRVHGSGAPMGKQDGALRKRGRGGMGGIVLSCCWSPRRVYLARIG